MGKSTASDGPVLVQVTFANNEAGINGGAMYNDTDTADGGPVVVNSIFWGNTTAGAGPQIYMHNNQGTDSAKTETLSLYNTIVQGGIGATETSGIINTSVGEAGFAWGSAPASNYFAIRYANLVTGDPLLEALADKGGAVQTIALGAGSAAIDKGVYVKKAGSTIYYSDDKTTWYEWGKDADNKPTKTATLPEGAVDLTASDARGYPRKDAPDLGAFEF